MGRPELKIDDDTILAMQSQGKHIKEISEHLGISIAPLSRRIAELKYQKGIISKYRQLQGLQLTELQFRVLEDITSEKQDRATLLEHVKASAILLKRKKTV